MPQNYLLKASAEESGNLIKCRLELKAQETLQCKHISYRPQIRLQIDQMSIKIEISRNIVQTCQLQTHSPPQRLLISSLWQIRKRIVIN